MLEIKNVSKSYSLSQRLRGKQALQQVDLSFKPGEIVGLFGENGAGKTTLMKCILGFLRYDGSITLDNAPITHNNIERLSFATSEHSFFPTLSAEAHRQFYKEHFPQFIDKRFTGLMEFFELPMHKPLHSFSTGQKNQFEVILALCQGADYILMDEPFAGNDVFNREDFYKVLLGILEPHETILLSTHLIEEVSNFISRAVLIRQGQIVGDVLASELEDRSTSLMDYIKQTYHYSADRVSRALDDITGGEE
ncbi:ATP-binding cassette domain-containing protein [Agathobaculum sp. LCP25S3_E8]|uniref:ATP-binding cassette domain-containing protein n=1 Tax=Agathobaculum sp. LCP25S3_E8 TaxID=3438735 RepID=UPI003F921478